ncbi:hypothetical protein Tco_0266387 [Tanacetum coccineum]
MLTPHTKRKFFAYFVEDEGKDFSERVTPLFATMMVQATQDEGVDSGIPTDSQQTPITTQPSSFRPQKKQSRRKQRKETEVPQDESHHDDSVSIPSNDPLLSEVKGCSSKGDCWFKEEGLKVGKEKEIKNYRGRIVDETQGRSDDVEMFNTDDLHGDELIVDMAVGEKQEKSAKVDERDVTTADEGVTAAKIDEITPTSAPTTVIDELTLAQTLIEIKAAKPKVVTTAATTTTTRPKARGVAVQEPIPLKRKDLVALDEEMARNLEAQLQAELIEEQKMARKKEEEANIALIKSWENT